MPIINQDIKEGVAIDNLKQLTFFTGFREENGIEVPFIKAHADRGLIELATAGLRDLGIQNIEMGKISGETPAPEGYWDSHQAPPLGDPFKNYRADLAPATLEITGDRTLEILASKGLPFPGKDSMYPKTIEAQGNWTQRPAVIER